MLQRLWKEKDVVMKQKSTNTFALKSIQPIDQKEFTRPSSFQILGMFLL